MNSNILSPNMKLYPFYILWRLHFRWNLRGENQRDLRVKHDLEWVSTINAIPFTLVIIIIIIIIIYFLHDNNVLLCRKSRVQNSGK